MSNFERDMANTMLDAADARIASLEADKADLLRVLGIADEKIRSGEDARGQYIRENAALEARCRELERQVEIGKDFCVAAPLASHDEPEVVADCEVCQWQSKMNDWYMANEPLETPWKCPRCHNLGFHSATGENYCTACANHFLHGHPDPLRSTAETFVRQPIDCKHEKATIKCPDCGIDLTGNRSVKP